LGISAPQQELKAYPTSIVLPTVASPAASTRAGDSVETTIGAWFNETEYTMFCEFQPAQLEASTTVFGISDDFNDTAYYQANPTGAKSTSLIRSGAASSATMTGATNELVVGTAIKVALGVAVDDFALSRTGQTQVTDTSGPVPETNVRLKLSGNSWTAGATGQTGYIKDFRYFARRLTNAEIEAMVGN